MLSTQERMSEKKWEHEGEREEAVLALDQPVGQLAQNDPEKRVKPLY